VGVPEFPNSVPEFRRVWNVLACGRNLNRNMPGIIEDDRFPLESHNQGYAGKMPKPMGYLYWGRAR
jgi:hypothetical protein